MPVCSTEQPTMQLQALLAREHHVLAGEHHVFLVDSRHTSGLEVTLTSSLGNNERLALLHLRLSPTSKQTIILQTGHI